MAIFTVRSNNLDEVVSILYSKKYHFRKINSPTGPVVRVVSENKEKLIADMCWIKGIVVEKVTFPY